MAKGSPKLPPTASQPAGPPKPPQQFRWLGPLAGVLDRFLSAPAAADPLYMSNRTGWQKARTAALWVVPLGIGIVVLFAYMNGYLSSGSSVRQSGPISDRPDVKTVEAVSKAMPNLDAAKEAVRLESNTEVDVLEAHITRGKEQFLEGAIRNNTEHSVHPVELVFDVTDEDGSMLGGVAVLVDMVAAHGTAKFRVKLAQATARVALVRSIKAH